MKKSKILVPALAVLALGVAGTATATVAWYAAGSATIEAQNADVANVLTASNVTSADEFTITANPTTPGAVRLTDESGKTFVWDGTQNLPVSDSGNAMAEVTMSLDIEYTGSNTSLSDTQISYLWDTVVDSKTTFEMKCEDGTDYSSATAPTGGNAPSAIAAAAGSTKKYGLKFAASSSTYNTGYVLNGSVTAVNLSFGKAQLKGKTFSSGKVTVELSEKIYVGVWGIDGFEQKSGDTYVAEFTPAIA